MSETSAVADQTLRILQGIDILQCVGERELSKLARGTRSRTYASGEFIVWAGEGARWTFIVVRGGARVYRMAANGKLATIYLTQPGDIIPAISERSFVDATEDDTLVCRIPRQQFVQLQSRHPEIAVRVEKMLVERLIRAYDLVEELICLGTLDRVRNLLSRLADKEGGVLSITREDLASMVGATRQQVTSCLQSLREEGAITYQTHRPREITVLPRAPESQMSTNS